MTSPDKSKKRQRTTGKQHIMKNCDFSTSRALPRHRLNTSYFWLLGFRFAQNYSARATTRLSHAVARIVRFASSGNRSLFHIVVAYTARSHSRPVCPLNKPPTSRGLVASRHRQPLPSCTLCLTGNKPKAAEKASSTNSNSAKAGRESYVLSLLVDLSVQ